MTTFSNIYISNAVEAFATLLEYAGELDVERTCHELAQRAQLLTGGDQVVITTEPIPPSILKLNRERIKYGNIRNLYTRCRTRRLCEVVQEDPLLFWEICGIIRSNPGITISSYAATAAYTALIDRFRSLQLEFVASNLPAPENAWTVTGLDSKVGFRKHISRLFGKDNVTRLPEGYICGNVHEVTSAVQKFCTAKRGFVIKVHNGGFGLGTKIVGRDCAQQVTQEESGKWVRTLFETDHIWECPPYVVETFIDVDAAKAGGFPSAEGRVTENGFILDYVCGQEVNASGEFMGVSIGSGVVDALTTESMQAAMRSIGAEYYKLGYRGPFDVDFAVGKDGYLYVLESNLRTTGGTHVYDLARTLQLFEDGRAFNILSREPFRYAGEPRTAEEVVAILSDLLYPICGESRGLVISYVSVGRPFIGLIAIGNDISDCNGQFAEVQNRFLMPNKGYGRKC